jgi:hypothetical protein
MVLAPIIQRLFDGLRRLKPASSNPAAALSVMLG